MDPNLPEEEEIVHREFEVLPLPTLMHFILVNERGRQGIELALKIKSDKIENKKGIRNKQADNTEENVRIIQKFFRAFTHRKMVNDLRQEELLFLDMVPDSSEELEKLESCVEELRADRKEKQLQTRDRLALKKDEVKEMMIENESPDIREGKLYERREWITDFYE